MYVAGIDQETFTGGPYATVDEAIDRFPRDADLEPGESFYVGPLHRYLPEVPGGSLLAAIQGAATSEMGDAAQGWLTDVTREHIEDLGALMTDHLNRWLERRGYVPDFYTVDDVQLHTYQGEPING